MLSFEEYTIISETADTGLAAKSKKSGVSIGTLRKVYNRGMAAWKTGHRPGTTPQQWAMARVNSYIGKGSGTYHGADKDLREEELAENNLPEVPKDKETGLPKKYVAGVSDSTAKARAAHFDKNKEKSDSDPEAYKPAPGDATAKTKPSKHTLKYRAMFGEDMDEEIYEACWDSHKQVGMKKKGDKMVPDCVPKNEEVDQIDEISSKLAGDYYGAATKKHIDKVGIKPNMYGRIAKDMGKKRAAGVDRAMDRITGARKTNEDVELDEATSLAVRMQRAAEKQRAKSDASLARTPSSIPKKEELSADEQFDLIEELVMTLAEQHKIDPETIWEKFDDAELLEAAVDAKGHKSSTGGLTQKGRDSYNAKGANLQAPVTTKPSELKAGSKAANRRKSFCARMGGMEGPMKKPNGEPTRKALALRKWNC